MDPSVVKYIAHSFVKKFYNSLADDVDSVYDLFLVNSVVTVTNPNSNERIFQDIDALKEEIKSLHAKTADYDIYVKTIDSQLINTNSNSNKIIVSVVVNFQNISDPKINELYVHIFCLEGFMSSKNATFGVSNFIIRYIDVESSTSPTTTKEVASAEKPQKAESDATQNGASPQSSTVENDKPSKKPQEDKAQKPKQQHDKKKNEKRQNEQRTYAKVVASSSSSQSDTDEGEPEKPQDKAPREQNRKNEGWRGPRTRGNGGFRGRGQRHNKKPNTKKNNTTDGVTTSS